MQNGLAPAHDSGIFLANLKIVAFAAKRVEHGGLDTRFDKEIAGDSTGGNSEAWSFQRSLNVHVVVNKVGDKLRVGQRLVGPAHDAEADVNVALLHERRNDGVKRTLAWRQNIGMSGFKGEEPAAILQCKARAFDDYA